MQKPKIFYNEDSMKINPGLAVNAIEEVFLKFEQDEFLSPPRHYFKNDNGAIAFTIGGNKNEGVLGFRVYDTFNTDINHEQFVTVYDSVSGKLKGLVFGDYIGALRTGAIGGVAIKYLSNPDSETLGLIGTGLQAKTQLLAACAVRNIKKIKVFSRSEENRINFVNEMSKRVGIEIEAVSSSEEAVKKLDIVIAATTSGKPVFDAEWLSKGSHVTSVGPKFLERHELDPKVAANSNEIYTDSIKQLKGYPAPHFLSETKYYDEIKPLSPLISGKSAYRWSPDSISLFLSVGLSGTEPTIANLLF